jgi:hypothetical protein
METGLLYTINDFANEGAFIIAAFIGGLAHYLKKMLRGETAVAMHEWFGAANLPATIYTGIVFFFVIVGALAGGIVDANTSFWAALYTGFATGFAVDAGFNSDGSLTSQLNTIKAETGELMFGSQAATKVVSKNPTGLPSFQPIAQESTDVAQTQLTGKIKVVIKRR